MESSKIAYYVLLAGGVGTGAGREIARLLRRHLFSFLIRLHAIDSDKVLRETKHPFHHFSFIGLQATELDAMRANIELFGIAAEIIDTEFGEFLHREDVEAGSRARRALTQLFTAYHSAELLEDMRQQLLELMNEEGARQIQPVLVGSVGGGCGSALLILLTLMLADRESRAQILAGFDDAVMRRPIVFAAEPYAMADQNNEIQQNLIYGNAFSFRQEAGHLQARSQLAEVNLTGLSNSSGVVLKTIAQLHRQLGNAAYWHMRHASLIESTKANYGFTHYGGMDAPERYSASASTSNSNGKGARA